MKKDQVVTAFEEKFGSNWRMFSAPGRINIIGEHTDYNEGFVMPATIDRKIWLAISPAVGLQTSIYAVDLDETVAFSMDDDAPKLPHWALYPYGVVKELQSMGYHVGTFNAAFGGDIPTGAGLSSSAALESVFGTALNAIFSLGLSKLEIARIGQDAEHKYAGVRCGLMDQFASVNGKAGYAILLDCRSLDYQYYPLNLDGYKFILCDTGVKHSLASSEYNLRRAACEEGVAVIRTSMPGVHSLRDLRPKDILPFRPILGEETYRCCEYVTEENERVLETAGALEANDLLRVGELLSASHRGLRDKYRVSCRELDLLVDSALAVEGVLGSRMMGGGFGGCTITLLKTTAERDFVDSAFAAFKNFFGYEPAFYNVEIGNGAAEEVV